MQDLRAKIAVILSCTGEACTIWSADDCCLLSIGEELFLEIGRQVFLMVLLCAVNSVLAIGGVGGLAVGLAGREILENLFTGLIILSSSPFEVGDEVMFAPPTGPVSLTCILQSSFSASAQKLNKKITISRTFHCQD